LVREIEPCKAWCGIWLSPNHSNQRLGAKSGAGVGTSGLATGILKNTTGTGAPSIAVAADFPTLNQSTTGNAATATNVAGTGITGATLAAGVVSSSLTSVGTLTALTVNGATNIIASNNAATDIGTGTTTSAVALGGGANAVTPGGGTAFHSIT